MTTESFHAKIDLYSTLSLLDLTCNSPYCMPFNAYDVSSENLVLDQVIIHSLIFSLFSSLICLMLYWCCIDIVKRNSVFITQGSQRLTFKLPGQTEDFFFTKSVHFQPEGCWGEGKTLHYGLIGFLRDRIKKMYHRQSTELSLCHESERLKFSLPPSHTVKHKGGE